MKTARKRNLKILFGCLAIAVILGASLLYGQNDTARALPEEKDIVPLSLQEGVQIPESAEVIKEHKLIVENSKYQLYFKEESLSVIIRDKETGSIMESIVEEELTKGSAGWQAFMKSGIVVQVLKGINIVPTTADIRKAKKEVIFTEKGFQAGITYEEFGIGFTLRVSLEENGIVVDIPKDSIMEESQEFKIGEIYVYPFLGHTKLGERGGYMFIPDGNGALINLEDNEGRFSSNYSQYVYGMNIGLEEAYTLSLLWESFQTVNEADKIMAPVFGMVHTDSRFGYLGIIESGNYSAKIEAYPNGAYTDYNWICSKYILRQIYTQPTGNREGSVVTVQAKRNEFDIKVRYQFVNKENANYTGLAKEYRNYLLETDSVRKSGDDFNIRLDFLGVDKENWMIFKKNVVMTTTDQIREIYGELQKEGVQDIISVYKGWQKNGVNALPITSYKADRSIGGTKKLTSLMKDAKEMGIDLYLYQDALRVNPDLSNGNFNIMKQITKRVYEERSWKYVFDTFRYLTPARSKANLERTAKSYLKKGADQIALSGITNILFTYTYKGKVYSRVDTANTYEAAVRNLDQDLSLVMEKPLSYLWKYSDAILDMPTASSNYIFTDREVPFLSIALKGIIPMYGEYVNFEANKQEYFLQLVEMGINPSFYITYEDPAKLQYTNSSDLYSSKYSVYKDTMIEYYKKLKEVAEKTKGALITEHNQYSNGVTVVGYDNGVKVYINYNPSASALVDGYELEPMSYKVGEK
ncbi:hypothetical protein HNQ56_002064 [Anaerotaenia torta]|uniref:DUF5696 domain-containing protein n=1 Tax=Anaerotaenia torta TaxID=433293 RepID=UPI003D1F55E7